MTMGRHYSDLRANRLMAGRLNEWLGRNGMSARELARRAGVSQSTIYSMTCGYANTSVAIFRKVCKAGKIDANWLLGLE